MAFLNSAPHSYAMHSQAIYCNFMKNPKHQMRQKAFSLEWMFLLLHWGLSDLGIRSMTSPMEALSGTSRGTETRHSSLACSVLSLLLVSHFHSRMNNTRGHLSVQPRPVLSRPLSKHVLWLLSLRAGEGSLYLGVKGKNHKVCMKRLRIELKDKLRQWHQQEKVR